MLTVDFINVGYGDAVFICESGYGKPPFRMLVDCGDLSTGAGYPGSQRIGAAEYLQEQKIRELDLLVLTHLHLDHTGGLRDLLPGVRVRTCWTNYLPPAAYRDRRLAVPPAFRPSSKCLLYSMNTYLDALKVLEENGTEMREIARSEFACSTGGLLQIRACSEDLDIHTRQREIWQRQFETGPDDDLLDELDRFINNTSIRLRLEYGSRSVELPGDVCAGCWEKHPVSRCAIVKLPHHGHRDSLSPELYRMMQPDYTVISVSNSRKDDCPSRAVVDCIIREHGRLFFTDAVEIAGCGKQYHQAVRFRIGKNGRISATEVSASGQ